ncbi:unnamed protein product, partial [Staurois parvus]
MGPPTDPGPSGSARVSKWSVRPWDSLLILNSCPTRRIVGKKSRTFFSKCAAQNCTDVFLEILLRINGIPH